jgi:LuxR family maltose regulon positive regulatory protein
VFIDEGAPMYRLLTMAAERGILPETTTALSAMFPEAPSTANTAQLKRSASPSATETLIDPLTDRECELLALIASGMSNAKLADSLFISQNTVKTHVRHLYAKLGATTRTEAVARARSLGLLT